MKLRNILIAAVVVVGIYLVVPMINLNFAGASAPSGLPSMIATSSVYSVGTTPLLLFSNGTASTTPLAYSNCSARVISTTGSAIMISFGDRSAMGTDDLRNHATSTVSGVQGHYQAASTTVAYDGGIYGCGEIAVYSFATGPITVSEFK